ncbi:MAG: ribosomal protein L11 methyltransferase [Deltaproteobacteria bacterium RIFOXYD12_FULL_50_9]|nr:MAG: ribosomal protein L11 methyltransferase [Deltaproteobacteria bacterium RIFOXYD12_FULL_50_9]
MTTSTFSHRPPRTWLKVFFSVPNSLAESAAAFLAELSDSGVELISDTAQPNDQPLEKIIGYLPTNDNTADLLRQIRDYLGSMQKSYPQWSTLDVHTEPVIEEDWGITWKKYFKPTKITSRLVVKPSWEEYTPEPDDAVLEIDPGMAFGTGLHASTCLALEIIDQLYQGPLPQPQSVLDVGTGTGILAMACVLFGAGQVIAIDNDPDAVAAAQGNISRNNLDAIATASAKDLAAINETFDLVIANITHDTIIELAPLLKRSLNIAGNLILSGILQGEQEKNICLELAAIGLSVNDSRYQEEWFAGRFTLKR